MRVNLYTINEQLQRNPAAFIKKTNAAYENQLREIAQDIAANREEHPIILLSGPSGSGKTTSAVMMEKFLDEQGIETHTLSLDNYFSPFTDQERILFEKGELDLESPQRVDKHFLTQQLDDLYQCRPVELPTYDFKESRRIFDGQILQRKPGELVILEGIHSLNPDILDFPDEKTAKIYISVRTRIEMNGRILHPSKIRLMRRLVRDMLFRKRTFSDTIRMFRSVEKGAEKYIMPFKYRSDYGVDTFLSYEICAYRSFLLNALLEMADTPLIEDACRFLDAAYPLDTGQIPTDSLIREFIGSEKTGSVV